MKASIARAWRGWTDVAAAVGTFQSRLLLTLVYFTWLVPFGAVMRLFSDPLDIRGGGTRPSGPSGWKKRGPAGRTIQSLRGQF